MSPEKKTLHRFQALVVTVGLLVALFVQVQGHETVIVFNHDVDFVLNGELICEMIYSWPKYIVECGGDEIRLETFSRQQALDFGNNTLEEVRTL